MQIPDADIKSCRLVAVGRAAGSCLVEGEGGRDLSCRLTLRRYRNQWQRRIVSIHLSRPENYLSIYQSGCNFSCRKCHSWYFSKKASGDWHSPADILAVVAAYSAKVTLWEPRERATAWHAHSSCTCCGSCVLSGERSERCPGTLRPEQIVLSPQGFGPARNIVAFTGGDLSCRPEFYGECAQLIKEKTGLWVLLETNGYGLTPGNLDLLRQAGVDSFWLDIKAADPGRHRWLTGCDNSWILALPAEIMARGFVLEVLSLYIPGVVEADELGAIAAGLAAVDRMIPFTILAFFPEHRMKTGFRCPTTAEMVAAYHRAREAGLAQVRLGNLGVFARTAEDYELLREQVAPGDY